MDGSGVPCSRSLCSGARQKPLARSGGFGLGQVGKVVGVTFWKAFSAGPPGRNGVLKLIQTKLSPSAC